MKKSVVRGLSIVFVVALFASSFAGCAKVGYVTDGAIQAINEIKDGSWKDTDTDPNANAADADAATIDEFVAGTYGGVKMDSMEDLVKYYVESYDYSKSITAQYKDGDGNTQTYYKLLGEEALAVDNILIEGSENSIINKIVPGIVKQLYSPGLNGLSPSWNRDPKLDILEDGSSLETSRLTVDDILAANAKDNNDGTITLQLQPKKAEMSCVGQDSQGKFFTVLGAIDEVVDSISVLSWSEGTTAENCRVIYQGGTGTITIDTKTKEIVKADYHMTVKVVVTHATVTVIKDKSAALDVIYDLHYPASAEYMMKAKKVVAM